MTLTSHYCYTYLTVFGVLRDGLEPSTYWLPYYRSAPVGPARSRVTPQSAGAYSTASPAPWSQINNPNANASATVAAGAVSAPTAPVPPPSEGR